MDDTVEHVFKNIRYKILHVGDKYYILDMDQPIWSIIFPFLYWFIPHSVYQIDYDSVEKLKMPLKHQGSRGWMVVLTTGISIFLAQLIAPSLSDFNSGTSIVLKSVVLVMSMTVIVEIRLYIYKGSYKKLIKL